MSKCVKVRHIVKLIFQMIVHSEYIECNKNKI